MPDPEKVRAALAEIDATYGLYYRHVLRKDAVDETVLQHSDTLIDVAREWLAEQDRKEANDVGR